MLSNFQIKSREDVDIEMLPAWATPVILTVMFAAAALVHGVEEKDRIPVQTKPACEMRLASLECK